MPRRTTTKPAPKRVRKGLRSLRDIAAGSSSDLIDIERASICIRALHDLKYRLRGERNDATGSGRWFTEYKEYDLDQAIVMISRHMAQEAFRLRVLLGTAAQEAP